MKIKNQQAGFTLIELMIATMVFSLILIGATTATIQIGRMYYKGVILARTQETARRIMDDITRPIQFSGSEVIQAAPRDLGGISTGAICIGNQRFSYGINAQVTDNGPSAAKHQAYHGLWQDTLKTAADTINCQPLNLSVQAPSDTNTDTTFPGREVLGEHMRLARFAPTSTGNLWTIDFLLIYGDDDLLLPDASAPTGCASLAQSAQWCATSALSTTVFKRINPN